jgi:serine protease Do
LPGASPGASGSAVPSGSATALAPGPDPNAVIVAVAAKVSPAVVTITSDTGGSQFDPFSVPSSGVGSGFVFGADGWILTNNHVIEGASSLTVAFKGGRELPGRVVTTDPAADLAVVKVDATNLATVDIGVSANLQVGQLLIAIGSPLGTFSDSVTSGILSATGRSITVSDFQTRTRRRMTNLLQTDAAINPGNSGGPLLDAQGLVIGINSAVATGSEGIGFAIPIDAAKAIMDKARQSG